MPIAKKLGNSRRRFLLGATGIGAGLAIGPVAARELAPRLIGNRPPGALVASARSGDEADRGGAPDRAEVAAAVERSLGILVAEGVDDAFPRPFELERLASDPRLWRRVAAMTVDYFMQPAERPNARGVFHAMIGPKTSMLGYRLYAHADLIVATRYLACAILLGRRLEPIRIPISANKIYSCRFKAEGRSIFDENLSYDAFCHRVSSRLDQHVRRYLVSADIAEFSQNIDIERLLGTLRLHGVEAWLTTALADILAPWREQSGGGLPIGPTASLLLGEAALLEVDHKLESDGVDFVRYIDDYRLVAPDLPTARWAIERLIGHLSAERLTLNHAKTAIDAVTSCEYSALLYARRSAKLWGRLPSANDFAETNTDNAPDTHAKEPKPDERQQPPQTPEPPQIPPHYLQTPFKKSQLDDFDRGLLRRIDPAALLAELTRRGEHGDGIRLGEFRLFAEAACAGGNHPLLIAALPLLTHNPHCSAYLIDVLIAEKGRIPDRLRARASEYFADRLVSGDCFSDHEAMHVAVLLGIPGYCRRNALLAYLQIKNRPRSSLVLRAVLQGLTDCCDAEEAAFLAGLCPDVDPFVRRAIFDLIGHGGRPIDPMTLAEYRAEFADDPFLEALSARA